MEGTKIQQIERASGLRPWTLAWLNLNNIFIGVILNLRRIWRGADLSRVTLITNSG